jgi:hypothetical protein
MTRSDRTFSAFPWPDRRVSQGLSKGLRPGLKPGDRRAETFNRSPTRCAGEPFALGSSEPCRARPGLFRFRVPGGGQGPRQQAGDLRRGSK